MEHINALSHQVLTIKFRQYGFKFIFRFSEHVLYSIIQINDIIVCIGHHNIDFRTV